jgi:ferredoxin
MTFGSNSSDRDAGAEASTSAGLESIHSMTTDEWRAAYMRQDGTVDLWVEEEFNSGSRLVVGGPRGS